MAGRIAFEVSVLWLSLTVWMVDGFEEVLVQAEAGA